MSRKNIWALAAKNGLYLSVVTIVLELAGALFSLETSQIFAVTKTIVKTVGSAMLLYYLMKMYSKDESYVSYGESFRYGLTVSFFSALACSVFIVIIYTMITPHVLDNMVETMLGTYSQLGMEMPGMDYDSIVRMLPIALTISQFLNCMFFGLLFSLIIANYTKKGNFFSPSNETND